MEKVSVKIGVSGDINGGLSKLFPLFSELESNKINFHFLCLKEEQDHISLRLAKEDKGLVEDLFTDLYELDIKDTWESYTYDEMRFGNEETQVFVDEFLSKGNSILLRSLYNKLQDYDYGNVLSEAVFYFYNFVKAITKNQEQLTDFYTMYFEHWKVYLPKGIGKKEIKNSWKEEIGILKTIAQREKNQASPPNAGSYYKDFAAIAKRLNQNIELQIAKNDFLERNEKFNYSNKLAQDNRQSKFEILADSLHFFLNAYGIQNEDEALVCLLAQSMSADVTNELNIELAS